VAIFDFRL